MERELDIRTPESITIRYELAGLGSRFLAVFLDLLVQGVATLAVYLVLAYVFLGSPARGRLDGFLVHTGRSIAVAIISAVAFCIFFGYFIVAEWRFDGRTIGKRIIGIRVVRDGGYTLDFLASAIRNLVRVLEAGLAFYALSAIVTLVSRENKRLGDYAAGTIVVRDIAMDAPVAREPVAPAAAVLDSEEVALVERYCERRSQLSAKARARVAARIAERLRPRLRDDPSFASLDDDGLILRIAQTR